VSTVATILSASAASTVLSDGTGKAIAVATDVPAVAGAFESTVKATVITAALAGATESVPSVMAATTARAIFLNEFIFLLVYSLYLYCF
jgi:hypothetical protein